MYLLFFLQFYTLNFLLLILFIIAIIFYHINLSTNFIEQYKRINNSLKNVFLVSIKNWINEENKNIIISQFADLNIEFISVLSGEFIFTKNPDYFVKQVPKLDSKDELKDYLFTNESFKFRYGYNQITFNFLSSITNCFLLSLNT